MKVQLNTGFMNKNKDENLLPKNDIHRRIIHLDMDAFYASVEMRDHPELRHKALVVAHDPREYHGHGVITTANYLARQYGVGSAMPAIKAVQQVPKDLLVFVPPNFEKYRAVSAEIHEIMHEVTDKVQSVSLDEAYLDVTQNKLGDYPSVALGNYLQEKIYRQTGLTSSFGVTYNKFLAKMGSEYAKPFGKTVILPEEALDFLAKQDISKFPGVGKKTQVLLREMGINTGADLQQVSVQFLIDHFKKMGYVLAMHSRGIDLSPVEWQRQRKSIGKERTFEPSIFEEQTALTQLRKYSNEVAKILQEQNLMATCVVLKIRDTNFETVTRRRMLKKATTDGHEIFAQARWLFQALPEFLERGIRLLGVSVTNLEQKQYQETNLFETL
ncbi:DNA polymerase IV [Lactobacillus xujianguonis]|uniref:DNA polymerase IV n=2 Tax=Lactobacillaceae TaxID=33958 RepID=A0A437SUJ2_9LACO|nr:DNA polymerase IV [Lactobacillus xujianguonis]RVU77039.1 DNA polymerase IV [Lactobacillus xujianguonis]